MTVRNMYRFVKYFMKGKIININILSMDLLILECDLVKHAMKKTCSYLFNDEFILYLMHVCGLVFISSG